MGLIGQDFAKTLCLFDAAVNSGENRSVTIDGMASTHRRWSKSLAAPVPLTENLAFANDSLVRTPAGQPVENGTLRCLIAVATVRKVFKFIADVL